MADENPMAGKGDQVEGSVKETLGKVSGDRDLEGEGKAQHAAGKVHEVAHDIKEDAEGLADKVTGHTRVEQP